MYQVSNRQFWQGRDDGERQRLFQIVECIDLSDPSLTTVAGVPALLGFACDEGIARNQGRVGARQGPMALRQALINMPRHTLSCFYDAGEVCCPAGVLPQAQTELAAKVACLLQQALKPLLIGGGHEIAWGHYQGIRRVHPRARLAVINFDAHFDLRPLLADGHGSSGTAFLQMAIAEQALAHAFSYTCLGIQPTANTAALFAQAASLSVNTVLADAFHANDWQNIEATLTNVIAAHDVIYLSICLDVFAQAFAPGVSAPQAFGLTPAMVIRCLDFIFASGKVVSVDIAELSPPYDQDAMTARLAAALVDRLLRHWMNE